MSVEIVNTSAVPIKISQGRSGVYRFLCVIKPGKHFLLRMNMKMGYSQYLLTTLPENLLVGSFLTYNDVILFSRIEIKVIKAPRDVHVWIGIPKVKRSGVMEFLSRLLRNRKQPVTLPIVNRLTDQCVRIMKDDKAGIHHTIKELAPGATFSLVRDPKNRHGRYHLSIPSEINKIGQPVYPNDFKLLSKIEVTKTRNKYIWEGT